MGKMLGAKKRKASSVIVIIVLTLTALLLLILITVSGCNKTSEDSVKLIAQPVLRCAPAMEVVFFLKRKFNEDPVYTGVYENKIIFTVFVSPSGSFTIVHTSATNQISCLVSSGDNFKQINWRKNKSV
tara:strand:- start:110 stop:493 length:384 start_codon:yes stop_codon:yes gene_type:complete